VSVRDTSLPVKLGLLASLYFAQGLPFGFFTQALPVMLRKQGVSLAAIGFSAILALPWALKFLWAPLVDRYGSKRFGHRRSWILPLQACGVLLLLALAAFPPEQGLVPFLVAIALTNLVAATQDVATDGLAVDALAPRERGFGNGVQVAGYRAGMILGGGVILALIDHLGWAMACRLLALGLLLSSLPLIFAQEGPRPPAQQPAAGEGVRDAFLRPGLLSWLLLLALFKGGDALGSGMTKPFLVDRGLDLSQIGWMVGIVGSVCGLLGALVGGASVVLLGRSRALLAFGLLQATGMLVYALAAHFPGSSLTIYVSICAWEHWVGGLATAALFTVMMDACRESHAATDYTVQACGVVLATGGAAAISGVVADAVGYPGLFWAATLLTALGAWIVARDPRVAAAEVKCE
jgi:PAT family beta-lactamase induction signal transducer AmpG